jgi:ADP-ribose pyrophosphatase YjhB (NUDIX family)
LTDAISVLVKRVPDPSRGLPEEIFYYISRTTPLINVDLLIKDEKGRTLLSWRDDAYAGKGWHVPGGIVRFKESLETRIRRVAEGEIGTSMTFDPRPMAINQIIHPSRGIRSHFISLLFKCFLPGGFTPENKGLCPSQRGFLQWHSGCPENLIRVHEIYRSYIEGKV